MGTRFQKRYGRLLRRVQTLLAVPRARQDAKWVHDVRSTVRRIEIASRLVPDRNRRKGIKQAVRGLREIRHRLDRIRDRDVLREILRPLADDPAIGRFLRHISPRSRDLPRIAGASSVASVESLAKRTVRKVPPARVHRRYRRLVEQRGRQLRLWIDRVLGGDLGPTTLHTLRGADRKMRYLLELGGLPGSGAMLVPQLAELQDRLGAIHDNDFALAELRSRAEGTSMSSALGTIARARDSMATDLLIRLRTEWRGRRKALGTSQPPFDGARPGPPPGGWI